MRHAKPTFFCLVTLFVLVFPPMSTNAQSATTTCDDFTYQQDAQEAWDRGEGRPRPDYLTGMDEDNDGIACEHLPNPAAFYETIWFWLVISVVVVIVVIGIWWKRTVKAANPTRDGTVLFPGRTSTEEVEDELALLKADKAFDEAVNPEQNQR